MRPERSSGGLPYLLEDTGSLDSLSFELGPIRPPSEARSLLLRTTRNCPWNRCRFCTAYKGERFQLRELEDIERDIQTARALYDETLALTQRLGYATEPGPVCAALANDPSHNNSVRIVAQWIYFGAESAFLQDANSLIMRTPDLVATLTLLKEAFPSLKRITSYGRSKTAVRKTAQELRDIAQAGLSRVHIGLETGSDALLEYMDKGVTAREHIEGGRKVKEAGMSLSEYVMPGLGGREMWREHVGETARVLNEIEPDFIRLRSLTVRQDSPLGIKLAEGEFHTRSEEEVVAEIGELIARLECHSYLVSDQVSNLLPEVEGQLPREKDRMLATIEGYLGLPPRDRLRVRLERRLHAFLHIHRQPLGELEEEMRRAFSAVEAGSPDAAQRVDDLLFTLSQRSS